jgi:hypothetical protein
MGRQPTRFAFILISSLSLASLDPGVCRADSVSVVISTRDDDAEEMGVNGNMLLNGATLDLVDDKGKQQTVGLRFAGCLIPAGAVVDSAFIDMVIAATNTGAAAVTIRCQAADNAPTMIKNRYDITTRPLTAVAVTWSPIPAWTIVGDTITSPNVGPIVQAVVGRPGWALGNAILFVYSGSGQRTAESYDGTSPLYAPRLRVYFSNLPDILVLKSAQTTADPVNGAVNPKAIPGADILYSLVATNYGMGATDSQSCSITDAVPANAMLFVGNLGAGGPILFTDGATSSGLTFTFTSLASATDDLDFSANGGLTFNYVPVPDAAGYDPSVTNIRVHPRGAFAAATAVNFPSFTLRFRVRTR